MSDMNETPKQEGVTDDAPPRTWDDLSPDERLLLTAVRSGDSDYAAYTTVRLFLKQGKTPAELLQAVIDTGDADLVRIYTKAVNAHINREAPVWTYERRLALHVLGVMGLDYPGLHDDLFTNDDTPSALHSVIDEIADALIGGMHTLGCPDTLDLAHILDYASSFNPHEEGDDE